MVEDEEDIAHIKNGHSMINLFGIVYYQTIFDDSCFTQYSMWYDYKRGSFVNTSRGNDADRNTTLN